MTEVPGDHGIGDPGIRQAGPADVAAVKAVTEAAYHHYIERIGRLPQPMESDHAARHARTTCSSTTSPSIPTPTVGASGGGCWNSWTHARVPSVCPRSALHEGC